MKRSLYLFATLLLAAAVFTSCHRKAEEPEKAPEKIVSLDLSDSTAFHELVHFYITNDIIPKEAVLCDHEKNGGIHTFACLAEDLELCAPDYLQDSLHGTFFQEVVYNPGSSGDNNIYICQKDEKGFHLRLSAPPTLTLVRKTKSSTDTKCFTSKRKMPPTNSTTTAKILSRNPSPLHH